MSALAAAPQQARSRCAAMEHGPAPQRSGTAVALGPGASVAGYRLKAVLGRGRYSIVYLARHLQGSRSVALKVVRGTIPAGGGAENNLEREFEVQAALAHRHVLQVFGHGECGGHAYLVMEYAARGPLATHGGRVSGVSAVSLFAQAASALAWLHGKGWVHRDVKPGNLLLRADGSLALGDFGCACRNGEAGALTAGLVVGTPRYAAPEQSEGAPSDPAADVYSLGVCLYEMLAGQPLFPGETLAELLGQHLLAPVPRLAREYAAWQPLMEAMLAKDPGHRPPDGQAVVAQLERIRHSFLRPHGRGSLHEGRNPT
jgi:serine/threonine protein kinase